eukprot:1236243-Rhodomonas_salina.1
MLRAKGSNRIPREPRDIALVAPYAPSVPDIAGLYRAAHSTRVLPYTKTVPVTASTRVGPYAMTEPEIKW